VKLIGVLLIFSSLALSKDEIQVQGNCEVKVTPDRGSLSFTAENQAKDQQVAIKKTNDQINSLKEKIQKLKLEDLELRNTNYNVYPVREYENNRMIDKGIKVSLSLEVTTSSISKLGEAMVQASELGISNVSSLTTFLSIKKSQEEYLKCLDIAAEDARKKADQLAKKLGFKVGEVTGIIEAPKFQQTPGPYPMPMLAKGAMAMDAAAPVSIEAGQQTFTTSLQINFAIK